MISVMNGFNNRASFGFSGSFMDKPFYQKFTSAANVASPAIAVATAAAAAAASSGNITLSGVNESENRTSTSSPTLATSSSSASSSLHGMSSIPGTHHHHHHHHVHAGNSQQYPYGYDWTSSHQAVAVAQAAHLSAQQAVAAAANVASVSGASASTCGPPLCSTGVPSPNAVAKATFLSPSTASGFDMMNPMCQADFYGSNFHAAQAAHAAAVASGHTWAYGYPQQYPFGAHPYPGTMVADMTGLAGYHFSFFLK